MSQLFCRDSTHGQRLSPQHADSLQSTSTKSGSLNKHSVDISESIKENLLREAEVVTSYLYGNRNRAAAQALSIHHHNNNHHTNREREDQQQIKLNSAFNVYYVGKNNKDLRQKLLKQPAIPPTTSAKVNVWPHSINRESSLNMTVMRSSQSYPTHQKSLESTEPEAIRPNSISLDRTRQDAKKKRIMHSETELKTTRHVNVSYEESQDSKPDGLLRVERRSSPNRSGAFAEKKVSPVTENRLCNLASSSSSSSDVYITTSDRTTSKSPKNVKSSGASTPLDDNSAKDCRCHEEIISRPGSAPNDEHKLATVENQQRSMSLPKSFLSVSYQPR